MQVEVSNFESEVIEASRKGPVLVDFWAPWCGPCRQLGPILERVAHEDESFTLAKLNTDNFPEVSQRYRVSSIPAVKLFVDGEVTDEFLGALPEAQVRRWLADALPSESRTLVADAKTALEAGDDARAQTLLEQVLASEPANAEAGLLLARTLVFSDPTRAAALASDAAKSGRIRFDDANALKLLASLVQGDERPLPDDAAKAPYLEGLQALASKDIDGALGKFVQSVSLNKRYSDDAARKACLALFAYLGTQDPLTVKHRRALEMALF